MRPSYTALSSGPLTTTRDKGRQAEIAPSAAARPHTQAPPAKRRVPARRPALPRAALSFPASCSCPRRYRARIPRASPSLRPENVSGPRRSTKLKAVSRGECRHVVHDSCTTARAAEARGRRGRGSVPDEGGREEENTLCPPTPTHTPFPANLSETRPHLRVGKTTNDVQTSTNNNIIASRSSE